MIIIASLEPKTISELQVKKIILTGADILRFNLGLFNGEQKIKKIKMCAELIEELHSNTKIMLDIPANKARLGEFGAEFFKVSKGEEIILKSASYSADCKEFIPVEIEELGQKVNINQTIAIGNGEIIINIREIIDDKTVRAVCFNDGYIQSLRSFNLPMTDANFLSIFDKSINTINEIEPDYLAIPYINNQVMEKILSKKIKTKHTIKLINNESLADLQQICQNKNVALIMMDRGKLAVSLPYETIGLLQKDVIKTARQHKKPIIITTQILESTADNFTPSRAEISDLTNIILDEANGIMLCKETRHGAKPAYTITVAKKIINEVKKWLEKKKYEKTQDKNNS